VAGTSVVLETDLGDIVPRARGKVRDIYEIGSHLLLVATDRISAFDVVLPNGIPDKGKVLNQLSMYWFDKSRGLVDNHVVTSDVDAYPDELAPYREQLALRSMLVTKLEPVPFECVVRGYLYGSGWKEYRQEQSVCGISLPVGMRLADKFDAPLFTPATKATSGHDVNVSETVMADALGEELTARLKDVSLRLYELGRREAADKGIIIADTKFEFGRDPKTAELYLIDEVLTPDSSRFWPRDDYAPGRDQPSFDKQFVREYLETLDWDKLPPGPELPAEVIEGTRERYLYAYRSLTGKTDL
jgi:phosphoribosylaminoimidazole-succinocarboxamide synthase